MYKTFLRPLLFFTFHVFVCLLTSCDDYDRFTTSPEATLTFSRDSIRFDTLLTTVPSSTQTLTVYNHGDRGLRITEVWLEQGGASHFRINIDGQDMSRTAENRVQDFEVRRRDSIIIRAEVTLPEFQSDEPHEVRDVLFFRLESGVLERVPLSVVGRDAFFLSARTLQEDTTFTSRRPIVVFDSLVVAPAATLTLSAGTQLYFHEGAGLRVRGRLLVQGTQEQPVVLRGDRTDHMFDYLPYDNLPSRWAGVDIAADSYGNEFNYLDLHSGNHGIVCDSSNLDQRKLLVTNSVIHNIGGDGLLLQNCEAEVANTQISNTLGNCVSQIGGDATFVHCTIAQFYPLSAARKNALSLRCETEQGCYVPLVRADYLNCVITGYADDVILFPSLDPADYSEDISDPQINYLFSHCFLATEVPSDELYQSRFLDNVFDIPTSTDMLGRTTGSEADSIRHEKNFQLFDSHDFLYDFTPKPHSPIRGIASPQYSAAWAVDRRGRNRLSDGAPDAGCYECVP